MLRFLQSRSACIAPTGADRNADHNGTAYSFGGGEAYQLQLSNFDDGTQHAAKSATELLCSSDPVEHLVPRSFAGNDSAEVKYHLIDNTIVRAAAKLTSELVRAHAPMSYEIMSRHAPNYRLFYDADVLWTTGRAAFMREGSKVRALHFKS